MTADEDPGWGPAFRPYWHFLVPILPLLVIGGRRLNLTGLRHLFAHVGVALIELAIVVPVVIEQRERPPATWAWVVLGLSFLWSAGGIAWSDRAPSTALLRSAPDRNLDEPQSLRDQFRVLCFIRLGLAASPALWGLAFAFLSESREPAYVGAVLSLSLLIWAAPRSARIDGLDAQLRARGISTSMRQALADG